YPRLLAEYVSRPHRADWLLEQVRRLALALPEAEERDSHGAPGWRIEGKSGKYFAYFSERHHGSDHIALLVKTDGPDELAALVERDPAAYFRPAFYGASGWVGLILNRRDLDWDHVEGWLARHTVAEADFEDLAAGLANVNTPAELEAVAARLRQGAEPP
ncbi:MAG: MmcQ/YjbR family DNA-binding protein, partial [Halorhodospira sp.]